MPTKRVVIVGGGVSAKHCAEVVLKQGKDKVDVTVIQANRFVEWSLASATAFVDPSCHPRFLSTDCTKFEAKGATYTYATAEGVDMEKKQVRLSNGAAPETFDALVVATGFALPLFYPRLGVSVHERIAEVKLVANAISKAACVVIGGGGLIALELAGDIRAHYADKTIILICRSGILTQWPDDFRQKVHDRMTKMSIQVVTAAFDAPKQPALEPGTITVGDKQINYDAYFPAFAQGPNTQFLQDVPGLLDSKGQIDVNEFLQSKACPEVFAVGVSNAPEPFVGMAKLDAQWTSVAGNVVAMLANQPLKQHKEGASFMKLPPVVLLGHGPKGYGFLDFANLPPPLKVCCCCGWGGWPCCPPCWPCCACCGCGACPLGYCCGPAEGAGTAKVFGAMLQKFAGFHFGGMGQMGEVPQQQTMN